MYSSKLEKKSSIKFTRLFIVMPLLIDMLRITSCSVLFHRIANRLIKRVPIQLVANKISTYICVL